MGRSAIKSGVTRGTLYPKQLGDWLNVLPWSHFITCTTKNELTLNSARRFMEDYNERINKTAPGTQMFWTAEKFECKDGYHTHALVNCNPSFGDGFQHLKLHFEQKVGFSYNRPETIDCFLKKNINRETLNGRFHAIKYSRNRGAAHYLGKYVAKKVSDYDFYSNSNLTKINF